MKSEHVVIALILLADVISLFYTPHYFCDVVGPFEPEDTESSISVAQGDARLITVFYNDTWHNLPIANATISVNNTRPAVVEVISALPDPNRTGYYIVAIFGKTQGTAWLTVSLSKSGYDLQSYTVQVVVFQYWTPGPRPPTFGLPALLLVIICVVFYNRRSKKRRSAEKPDETSAAETSEPSITPNDEEGPGGEQM